MIDSVWEFTKLLTQILEIFLTLGLKILRLLRQKVVLKHISLKVDVNSVKIINYLFSMTNCCIKHLKITKILQICLKNFCEFHIVFLGSGKRRANLNRLNFFMHGF